jgi:ubiquinone/menaquinone biosynthesis C-methylase UbiE
VPRCINVALNTKETRKMRARACSDLKGEVLEIGFGSGLNLPHLPESVTRLMAVDPSGTGVKLAKSRIAASSVPVELIGLDGQHLPLEDASVDAVLCTWSLCTIPDAAAAVSEARRVLRASGTFHFVEHGLAPDEKVRRWQNRLNGLQQRMAGGCNLNRSIDAVIEAGGMKMTRLDRYYGPGLPKTFGSLYEGIATPA